MNGIGKTLKYAFSVFIVIGLAFSSGVFGVLLYGKITDRNLLASSNLSDAVVYAENMRTPIQTPKPQSIILKPTPIISAMLTAPLVKQNPELPSGCEITSLTMLLQYYGINKNKMDLVPEMKYDPTEAKTDNEGNIIYWGNPNSGFVGDITGNSPGFGIYHTALMELLHKYVPTAVDLTGTTFETLEQQIALGIPVEVWTTVDYLDPVSWVEWDSPSGPIRTSFAEHAVLLVGYDQDDVYVNDPLSGQSNVQINKALFTNTWGTMGKQALSYNK
jgi:uncharacterized protein YvpB